MDVIGEICWYMIFFTPFLCIPLVWKFSSQTNGVKLLIGLLLAFASDLAAFALVDGVLGISQNPLLEF